MKRLDVLTIFDLAEQFSSGMEKLALDKAAPFDFYISLIGIEDRLREFIDAQAAFPLSRGSANLALQELNAIVTATFFEGGDRKAFKSDLPIEMNSWTFWRAKKALQEFRHVFSAECRSSETYFMEKKIGFDIATLLHSADHNLHETIRPWVPVAALNELKEAGRCLALESYTASGFHTLRGLEVVMAAYYKTVSDQPREFKSWFDYVGALEALSRDEAKVKRPSPKVAAMLDRMRQLDRNPLMHPSDTLDEVGADSLFKLGIVTITELAKDMREMAGQTELKLVVNESANATEG